jgi:cbb3-type cytochrome oxidase maturation protein
MSVILILILASLGLALAFLAAFVWAVRAGQYEDTFTPSMRVLIDSDAKSDTVVTLINTPLQGGGPGSPNTSNRLRGFHAVYEALTTRETAEAVPGRPASVTTRLKPDVNENPEHRHSN